MGEEEGTIRFGLRLPASLHEALLKQAREHHRSLNSEIVFVLGAGFSAAHVLSQAEQMLSKAEESLHESEQIVDDHDRQIEERLKVHHTRLEELATDFQKIKERALVLPQETVDMIEVARGVAERKGKTLGALFDEVFRRIVNEQELVKEASSQEINIPTFDRRPRRAG